MGSRFVTPYFAIKKLRRVEQNGVERSDFMEIYKFIFILLGYGFLYYGLKMVSKK